MKTEHVAVFVRDLEKSREFYEDFLGFRQVKIMDNPVTGGKLVYLDLGGTMIELIWNPSDVKQNKAIEAEVGLHHICIFVEDVEKIMGELKKKGVPVREEPVSAIRGGKRAYVYDPDGVPIEFVDHW